MSCPPAVSYMGGQEEEEVRSNTSLSSEVAMRQEGGHKSQPVDMTQVRATPGEDEEMALFAGKTRYLFFLCHRPGGGDSLKLSRWPGYNSS